MSETTTPAQVQSTAPQTPEGAVVFTPEQQAHLRLLAEAANQQDRARSAAGLPTRVAADIWGGIREAPGQIARGATEALDAAAGGLRALVGATGLVSPEFMANNPATPVAGNVAPEATTVTGGLVNDVSQFVAGMIPAGRLMRAAGVVVGAGASTGARVGAAAVQGALTDAIAFDPHEERLSNLVEQYPALSNPVSQFLAAKPDDGEALGRLKNALEGAGIGLALDATLHGIRAFRAWKQGDTATAEAALRDAETASPQSAPRDPVDNLRETKPAAPAEPPPPAEGMVRMYHGSAEHGRYDGDAWFSSSRSYAENYRQGGELQYVDVPASWANTRMDPDGIGQGVTDGFTLNVEIKGDEFGPRRAYNQRPPEPEVQSTAPTPDPVEATLREMNARAAKPAEVVANGSEATSWIIDSKGRIHQIEAGAHADFIGKAGQEGYVSVSAFGEGTDASVAARYFGELTEQQRRALDALKAQHRRAAGDEAKFTEQRNEPIRPVAPEDRINLDDDSPILGEVNIEGRPQTTPNNGPPPIVHAATKLVEVDDAGLRLVARQNLTETGFGQGRSISGIRTDLIESGDDVASMMNSLRVVYRDELDRAIGGTSGRSEADFPVRSLAEVRQNANKIAEALGDNPDLFWQRMSSVHGTTKNLDAELLVYRDTMATVQANTKRLAEAIGDPLGVATAGYGSRVELMNQYRRHVEIAANIQIAYKGIQSNIARSLNSMRLPANIDPKLIAQGADAFFEGGEEGLKRHAARVAMANDLVGFNNVVRGGYVRNVTGAVNEYWINAVLSGPKTHAVNIMSNSLTMALQPAERMIAGALRVGSSAGRQEFSEGALQYVGLVLSLGDAFRLAGRALKTGDSIIDPGRLAVDSGNHAAITSQRLGTPGSASAIDPISGSVLDGLGTLIRLPTRLLLTEDEFFKQMTYRARLRAEGLREGFQQHGLNIGRVADAAEARVRGSFDPVTGQALDEAHLRAARDVTFSNDLKTQTNFNNPSIGETVQKIAQSHPGLTMVLPFVRTPTNILRFVGERTPVLNMARAQYRNDLLGRNGIEARGAAYAKLTTGGLMWGTAAAYAMEGHITGGGPADPQAKRELMQTGWRPYSLRVEQEDGSVEYRAFDRLDPFGMFFGLAADFAEIRGFANDRDFDQLATDAIVALARNLNNKTYLSGLTRALGALTEPERKGERFLWGMAGSFVPSALNQTLSDDPHMREVRSLADAFRARTPGLSQDVDPVRNILGEVVSPPPGWGPDFISPIATNTHRGGQQPNTPEWRATPQPAVHDEIARQLIIHGASIRPPAPEYGSVDLRTFSSPDTGRSAYDRYLELTGSVTKGGKTLSQTLEGVIRSDTYRNRLTDGTFDHDGSRVDVIRQVIGEYRLMAQAQLRREIPDLAAEMRREDFRRASIKINNPSVQ